MNLPTPRKFTRLEDMPVDVQVEGIRALIQKERVNPRLREVLSVSQSPAHWQRWKMDMGSGRMIEVKS